MNKITIIGAGNSGLAMAAHLSSKGYHIKLWNRNPKNIELLKKTKIIRCAGILQGDISVACVTSNIQEAVYETDIIMVTTPANSHKDIAKILAPHLQNTHKLICLNPGRTLGALEFEEILQKNACSHIPDIIETQTIIYTCRKTAENAVSILAMKKHTLFSSLQNSKNEQLYSLLPSHLQPYFVPAMSIIETSLGNVGMILHCLPVLLNTGWIENDKVKFKYYYDGITLSIASLLERLDQERVAVASALGFQIRSICEWFKYSYDSTGKNLYECIQNTLSYKSIDAPRSLNHRYIHEDISTGLVPLEALGQLVGLPMKTTTLVIDLASNLLEIDFRQIGRNLSQLGINEKNYKTRLNINE